MIEREQAVAELREVLKPGDVVQTILRHVSKSGMTRHISLVIVRDGEVRDISWLTAKALEMPVNRGNHEGIKIGGCGMDMGFSLVYSLSRALWPDGFECTGDHSCRANDHSNDYGTLQLEFWDTSGEERIFVWSNSSDGERKAAREQHDRMRAFIEERLASGPEGYHVGRIHRNGGYALRQRWL